MANFRPTLPQNLELPEIKAEDLRASALMDQSKRMPLATRNLNHLGKYAYRLAIAQYLWQTQAGNQKNDMGVLQQSFTSSEFIINISKYLQLDEMLETVSQSDCGYDRILDAFYAWMGAAYAEQGILALQEFVEILVEGNISNLLDALDEAFAPRSVPYLQSSEVNNRNKENLVIKRPSKHSLRSQDANDPVISPCGAPNFEEVDKDKMNRRKIARPRPISSLMAKFRDRNV